MSRPPYPTYPHHHPHHGRPYITVHDHDILCGRGVNIASHPGNERFRALVQSRHDENYCTAYTTSEKRAVAEQILKHIKTLDPPGRFLKRVGRAPTARGLQGPWEELTDRESIKKTCQALRDCNRTDRSGYAAAVNVPEDVRQQSQTRSMTGMSNKEQAAAAAAAKIRAEGGPMHPQHQPSQAHPTTHPGMRIALAPGPVPMPYHSGMPGVVPVPMAVAIPPPMTRAPMPVRPDLSSTSSHSHVYAPAPMPLPPPPPSAPPHHLHQHHPPPHHHLGHAMPHHHHHPHAGPPAHHHQHSIAPAHAPPPGHAPAPGHAPPPSTNGHHAVPSHHHGLHQQHHYHHQPHHHPAAPVPPPPNLPEKPRSPHGHMQPPHEPPSAVVHSHHPHHAPPPQIIDPSGAHEHRRHSSNSHSSEASKRSRSTYEDDGTVSPSVESAADWHKKQKSVDTRAPATTAQAATTANSITPTDSVGPGFLSDGMHPGYDIAPPPTRTPSQETTTTTGTTPTSEGTSSLSRPHRPSLSPASAMPPSPTLAYNPHHAGPANPTLHSHHHDYASPPTPTVADHPYAFHPHYFDPTAHPPDPKHSYNGASGVHLDPSIGAAAEAAAAAVEAADSQIGGEFATSSPGSYHHDDSLPLM